MINRTNIRVTRYQLRHWAVAAGLLATIACARLILFGKPPPPPDAYFRHVAALAAATPTNFGSWVSLDAPVPPAAITMLRPNVTVSKEYTNLQTGQRATLLLVQCRDASDLQGHYPPACYVAHGYRLMTSTPKDWQAKGLTIEGMQYTFLSSRPEVFNSMIIYDFMILPDGRTCRDMDSVRAAARDPRRNQLGAAQMQVLMDTSMSEDVRDAVFLTLVQANRPTLDAILAGDQR